MKLDDIPKLAWDGADGLLPAVIQHARTGTLLMLGYMNRTALRETLNQGRVVFYSRSRQKLWLKGETSGHFLDVVSVTAVTHIFAQDMRTRRRGQILLVASLMAYQGVEKFAVYAAAKAYVLRLGEALHRELKHEGVTVTTLSPGMSDTGFATAAQQTITPALKRMMMQPAPVVRAGIRALQAGRISVVPGWANKAVLIFTWATPRWLHQATMSRVMNA